MDCRPPSQAQHAPPALLLAFAARTGFPPARSPTATTPWSVFQDGWCSRAGRREPRTHVRALARPHPSLAAGSGTFDSLCRVLFIVPSRYLFAIGVTALFSLGRSAPPALGQHSRAARLLWPVPSARLGYGALTLCGATFQWLRPHAALSLARRNPVGSRRGLVPVRSPLLRESLLVSRPPLNDMLKFRGSSGCAQAAACASRLRLTGVVGALHVVHVCGGAALRTPYRSAICVREPWLAELCASPWIPHIAALFLDP